MSNSTESKCPFNHGESTPSNGKTSANKEWWPNRLNLHILRQHSSLSDPMEKGFDYAEEFKNKLDPVFIDYLKKIT